MLNYIQQAIKIKTLKAKNKELQLALKEQSAELGDLYDYDEMVQQMNHDLRLENIQVRGLYSSLNKRILQGELH